MNGTQFIIDHLSFPNYELRITNSELRITNHQLTITNYQSPITNHQLPITNHQLPITNHYSPDSYLSLPSSNGILTIALIADVAELVDARVSEARDGDIVEVQVLSSAPFFDFAQTIPF